MGDEGVHVRRDARLGLANRMPLLRFSLRVVATSVLIWVSFVVFVWIGLLLMSWVGGSDGPTFSKVVVRVVLAVVVVLVELETQGGRLFLANNGIGRRHVAVLSGFTIVVLEALIY